MHFWLLASSKTTIRVNKLHWDLLLNTAFGQQDYSQILFHRCFILKVPAGREPAAL